MFQMSDYLAKLKALASCVDVREPVGQYPFNPLKEFHANENAHTRVLVALLKNPKICRSFLVYLRDNDKCPSAKQWFKGCESADTEVSCFSDYIDATITVGKKVAILENKINGAEDQDAQIDRYVETWSTSSSKDDLLVLYLTRDGSKIVSEKSFNKSKEILRYESPDSPGRFLAINYKESGLCFSIDILSQQPLLYSGILQYVDYLEGDDCLGLAERNKEWPETIKRISQQLDSQSLDSLVCLMTACEKELARIRAVILAMIGKGEVSEIWDCIPKNEQAWALKVIFCSALNIASPDEQMYVLVPENLFNEHIFPDVRVAMSQWVNTSLLQVDFYFDGHGDRDEYKSHLEQYEKKLKTAGLTRLQTYVYNDEKGIRCSIDVWTDLKIVLEVLGKTIPQNNQAGEVPKAIPEDFKTLISLRKPLSLYVRQRMQSAPESEKWKAITLDSGLRIDERYGYQNGWAIQLTENFTSEWPIRAIEFFPARNCDLGKNVKNLDLRRANHPYRCYRWDGRVVWQFPVVTKEEAKELVIFLDNLRTNSANSN